MFYGIIGSLLSALSTVSYKFSLETAGPKVPQKVLFFYGYFFVLLFLIPVLFFLDIESIKIVSLLLLFLTVFLSMGSDALNQYAYKHEKISILAPYGEFETILTVIFGFLLLSGNSLFSFISALIAGSILVLGSFDLSKASFSKYCLSTFLAGLFKSLEFVIYGYLILKVSIYRHSR